jgi:hypothetical protein
MAHSMSRPVGGMGNVEVEGLSLLTLISNPMPPAGNENSNGATEEKTLQIACLVTAHLG